MTVDATPTLAPPADLPTDPAAFFGDLPRDLPTASPAAAEIPVLDQLGAVPFKKLERGGFPFLGFLASVYEHVSSHAATLLHPMAMPLADLPPTRPVASLPDAPPLSPVEVPPTVE